MWVKPERRNAQRQHRNPKVNQIRRPQRQRHIKQHDQRPHPQVYARASKPRKQDAKVDPSSRESTSSGDVPGASERQVAEDRVRVNLGREYFKDR